MKCTNELDGVFHTPYSTGWWKRRTAEPLLGEPMASHSCSCSIPHKFGIDFHHDLDDSAFACKETKIVLRAGNGDKEGVH